MSSGRESGTPSGKPSQASERRAPTRFAIRLRRDKTASLALVLLGLLILCALLAPLLSPYAPDAVSVADRLEPPSLRHPLGTDDLGRDLLSRVMVGGRVSLAVGILATMLAVFIGMVAGAVSGYWGGVVDALLMRATDVMLSIPVFFIVLFVASIVTPGLAMICLLIGMTQWMDAARVVRAVVLSTKNREFVEAARALGVSHNRILSHHILSHASGPVLVTATIGVAQAMMMESALSFLGFGVQPPSASWGSLLRHAQAHLGAAPWAAIFPGLMIFLTVFCCYAISDFLRAALAPKDD